MSGRPADVVCEMSARFIGSRMPYSENRCPLFRDMRDRKSTRLNSSHSQISYAVFCLKKKANQLSRLASADAGVAEPSSRTRPAAGVLSYSKSGAQLESRQGRALRDSWVAKRGIDTLR